MDIAEDFMDSFLAAYPQASSGNLNMKELDSLMAEHQKTLNNMPLDDFDGLHSEQMANLLNAPFTAGSILKFRQGLDEHVDQVPFFKLSELLLDEIQKSGSIKLTKIGNLPTSICEMLYGQDLIELRGKEFIGRIMEDNIPYLWPLKQYIIDSGIVKKRHNVLTLTKQGEKMMKSPKAERFVSVFTYMSSRFNWSNFYDNDDEGRCGQFGWPFSLVLLSKYGDTPRESQFYSTKLIQAFDVTLWKIYLEVRDKRILDEDQRAYDYRFFENFATWFGLVNIQRNTDHRISYRSQLTITKSPLFDQIFEVKSS